MAWEIFGIAITVKCVLIATGTVAAIGIVAYGIYKYRKSLEGKHQYSQDGGNELANFTAYEDIKPKTQDTKLRRRNVNSDTNCHEETQATANNLSIAKSHQGTEATPPNSLSITKSHQETQTEEVFPTPVDLSGVNIAVGNSNPNDDEAINVTSNGAESVYSFNSMSSGSSSTCNIPKWSEMSNEEKCLCICTPCGRIVTTITYPCKHPYFCSECAPVLFKFYHRCPKCKHRIKSFDNV